MSEIAFRLGEHAWKRTFGDLTLIGTWAHIAGIRAPVPCIVIINTDEEGYDHYEVPFYVPLPDAWRWDGTRGDARHCAERGFVACTKLRKVANAANLIRIRSLVESHVGDLLHIPPYIASSHRNLNVIAEAVIRNNRTGQTIEVELKDDV